MQNFRCIQCKKDINMLVALGGAIPLSFDGDFVCSTECKNQLKQRFELETNEPTEK